MYTQSLNTREAHAAEDPVREARFQARVDAEEKIEPNDWMPEAIARRWCGRLRSMRIPKSSACCRKATGSRARPR